jgi:hemolysin activation/secretion protein
MKHTHLVFLFTILLLLITAQLTAAPFPDSGSMYRQFKDDALRNIEKEKKEPQVGEAPPDKEITFDDSHQLYVNGFMIVGNEHLGEEELHNVMQPFINRSLSTTQLCMKRPIP